MNISGSRVSQIFNRTELAIKKDRELDDVGLNKETPIHLLPLSVRILNALESGRTWIGYGDSKIEIKTLGDILNYSARDLLYLKNYGYKAHMELEAFLKKHGFKLKKKVCATCKRPL